MPKYPNGPSIFDARDAAACQVGSNHRIARIEADLQTEQHGTLGMRLHGAAQLAVDVAEEGSLSIGIEVEHVAESGGSSENAGRRGTEKAQARRGGYAEVTCNVDPQNDRRDEIASADSAKPVRMSCHGGETHGHRMNDGGLVHAIEFRIVDLVTVDHGRGAPTSSGDVPSSAPTRLPSSLPTPRSAPARVVRWSRRARRRSYRG
jgi:hypothetical protein